MPKKDNSPFSFAGKRRSGSKFMAQLLGLDQEQIRKPGSASGGSLNQPLMGAQSTEPFHAVKITPGRLILFIFFGFIVWLAVVYYGQNRRTVAEQVPGNPQDNSGTLVKDSQITESGRQFPAPDPVTPPGQKSAMPAQTGSLQSSYPAGYAQAPVPVLPAKAAMPYGSSIMPYGAPVLPPEESAQKVRSGRKCYVQTRTGARVKTIVDR